MLHRVNSSSLGIVRIITFALTDKLRQRQTLPQFNTYLLPHYLVKFECPLQHFLHINNGKSLFTVNIYHGCLYFVYVFISKMSAISAFTPLVDGWRQLTFDAEYYGDHRWKVVQLNMQISQGSVATGMWWGGSICFCLFRSLSLSAKVKALLRSYHICQSYRKNRSGVVLFSVIQCIIVDWVNYHLAFPGLDVGSAWYTDTFLAASKAHRYFFREIITE